ncbi:MAG: hypothetical protein OEY98_14670 [Acidimicrobiia bacterium]|nr:hypothetical protein [Acidimicrobiia bacterium]
MSDVSQAIAQSTTVPEELVMRSAKARAQASGTSVDDVLAAWAGGGSIAASGPSPTPASDPAPAAATEVAPEAGTQVAAEVVATAAPVTEPVAVAVLEMDEDEPIEAVALRDRLAFAVKIGAAAGLMFGIFVALVSTRVALSRIAPEFEGEALRASSLSAPADVLLYVTALTTIFGALLASAAALIPTWFDRGYTVRTSTRSLTVIGAAVGAVAGLIGSGVIMAAGSTVEPTLPEDPVMVALAPVGSSILLVAVMVAVGIVVSTVVQAMALPAGLTASEEVESDVIKHRLATSYLMPVLVIGAIASFVLPFAWLLLTFHASAPLIAIVAAGGILTFAGLAASKPNGSISAGEFAVAAVGIGIVLLFVALVTNAVSGGGGHSDEESPTEDHAVVQVRI